jgi:hypothetical protein
MDQYEIALAKKIREVNAWRNAEAIEPEGGYERVTLVTWTNITARVFVNIFRGIWVGVGMYLARVALLTGKLGEWTGISLLLPTKTLLYREKTDNGPKNNNKN